MADYVSILNRAIDGLSENNHGSREEIYTKARTAIDRQLRAMDPPPSENAIKLQLETLEEAIVVVETEHAPNLETIFDELNSLEEADASEAEVAKDETQTSDTSKSEPDGAADEVVETAPVEVVPTKAAPVEEVAPEPEPAPLEEVVVEEEHVPAPKPPFGFIEDIDLIDGIGPKTAKNLNAAGIVNISQIAAMNNGELETLALKVANRGAEKKQAWKEQALEMLSGKLPRAKSDQERLKKLKASLPVSAGGKLETPKGFIEDVSLIDGVGAKTAELLAAKGVTTITQIAGMPNLELAEVTKALNKPGLELKQEWKAQATSMLLGKQPRAKSDQERLKKLRAEAPAEQYVPNYTPPEGFIEEIVLVDGIGEKTAMALNAVGVTKISQIAAMNEDELAEATKQIGIPGFEKTQEWRMQAIAMVNGELPRARNDRDKLIAMKAAAVTAAATAAAAPAVADEVIVEEPTIEAPVVEEPTIDETVAETVEEATDEIADVIEMSEDPVVEAPESVKLADAEAPAVSAEDDISPEVADLNIDEDEVASFASAMEELASETAAEEDEGAEDVDAADAGADEVEQDIASLSETDDAEAPDLTIDDILGELENSGPITSAVVDPIEPATVDMGVADVAIEPSLDMASEAPAIQTQPQEYVNEIAAAPETLGMDAVANDLDAPQVGIAQPSVGKGRLVGCAGLLALLAGLCFAAWQYRADIGGGLESIRSMVGLTSEAPAVPKVGTKIETAAKPSVETVEVTKPVEPVVEETLVVEPKPVVVPEPVVPVPIVPEPVGEVVAETPAPVTPTDENEIPLAQTFPAEGEATNNNSDVETLLAEENASQPETVTIQPEPVAEPKPVVETVTPVVETPVVNETVAAAPLGETAHLYEEAGAGSTATRTNAGVQWSVVQEPPADGLPAEAAIRGTMNVPEKGLSLSLTIRRNADAALPASHVIEILFSPTEGFEGRNIENVNRFVMKPTEQARGEGLIGVPAKIADGFFFIALNNLPQAKTTNERLLKNSDWIDIPLAYLTGRRGLVTMNKGVSGQQAFTDAFADWRNR